MSGRDNAHLLDRFTMPIRLSCRVRYHQEQTALDQSKRLPALLAIHDAILHGNEERIKKYLAGFLETDAVLALVGEVLRLIPLEPDSGHYNIVTTIVPLCKPGQWRGGSSLLRLTGVERFRLIIRIPLCPPETFSPREIPEVEYGTPCLSPRRFGWCRVY